MTNVTNHPTARERQLSKVNELGRINRRLRDALLVILGQATAFRELNRIRLPAAAIEAAQQTGALIEETAMAAINSATETGMPHVHVRIQGSDDADTCAQCGLDLRDSIHLRVNDPRRKSATEEP